MANTFEKAAEQLRDITKCPICMNAFTDPRILPCIHTFCFECLKYISEANQKKPVAKMPCPMCRKEFAIPEDGMQGVQKNFFMENFLEFKKTLQMGSDTTICDMCNIRTEGKTGEIPKATMRCLECQDYYCDSCVKVHQFQKVTKHHQMITIGSDVKSETRRLVSTKSCPKHSHNPLNFYCSECKKIVCVSCFVESHKLHDCKDVNTVDEEFRQTIEKKALKISTYVTEMCFMRKHNEKRKDDFLKEMVEKEEGIHKRNLELKDMIDRHTKSLLDELSSIKAEHLKEMETGLEEIDRCCTILGSFEEYCRELTLKGSASDICSSVDELIARANDLERDHEAFIGRPRKSIEISFQATDLKDVLQISNSNLVGIVEAFQETTSQYESFAVVVGLNDGTTMITSDVVKINLHRPNEITTQEQIPTKMVNEAIAEVYDNTMYVAGIGDTYDEIWKYSLVSGWVQCAPLVQSRRKHCAAFIGEVMYICGGFVDSTKRTSDSVEAYSTATNKCTTIGKLVHCVQNSGNCVPFKGSLYIFGGTDKDYKAFNHVQVFSTKENTCSLLSTPMPSSRNMLRAELWETTVVLLGWDTCFIFNIEKGTWQERIQFKTDVAHFGLVLENGRLFVIGGGSWETDKDGKTIWKCRDDVRYIPLQNILDDKPIEWKIKGKLPKPSFVQAYAKMRSLV